MIINYLISLIFATLSIEIFLVSCKQLSADLYYLYQCQCANQSPGSQEPHKSGGLPVVWSPWSFELVLASYRNL